ncbi:MAG: 16S rRNA (cytosine(1402)-N(4))-methyltransferase RsmH [Anderseniella sp.]|nr:16S rRNA (cytosine(1402)-N(4))-methyltransferase RsmH [Anderseniella sp.]
MTRSGDHTPDLHIPVLLGPVMDALCPVDGELFVDGTFGAGGYTKALLDTAPCKVIAIDRDPNAIAAGGWLVQSSDNRLTLVQGRFSQMEQIVADAGCTHVDGIVLDVGVSSMQLDQGERGFSFMRDGPLDMRMEQEGISAADVVNDFEERDLRHIIGVLGEEKRAFAIAKAITRRREQEPFTRTLDLAALIEATVGRPPKFKGPSIHPATRTFQALRIYVNAELRELAEALAAAERLLAPGGRLAIVTFHSLEDRIVKRFLHQRSGRAARASRHAPQVAELAPSFDDLARGGIVADEAETSANPRARSARLRAGKRTEAAPHPFALEDFGREVTLC